jgi:hypothetical protein
MELFKIEACNGLSYMRKGGEEIMQAIDTETSSVRVDHFIHMTRTR